MERYPDYLTYRQLYAKYIDGRDVGELLDLLEPVKDMRVLDLCCGEGRVSLEALKRGAKEATLVDAEKAMIPTELLRLPRLRVQIQSVHTALVLMRALSTTCDRIVCRQAVNYWMSEKVVPLLSQVLAPGGIFAFNTFNQEPSVKTRRRQYERDGHLFVELSWLVGDMVHHVQVRDGMAAHFTSFRWISPEEFRKMLETHFTVNEVRRKKTSLYQCVKK